MILRRPAGRFGEDDGGSIVAMGQPMRSSAGIEKPSSSPSAADAAEGPLPLPSRTETMEKQSSLLPLEFSIYKHYTPVSGLTFVEAHHGASANDVQEESSSSLDKLANEGNWEALLLKSSAKASSSSTTTTIHNNEELAAATAAPMLAKPSRQTSVGDVAPISNNSTPIRSCNIAMMDRPEVIPEVASQTASTAPESVSTRSGGDDRPSPPVVMIPASPSSPSPPQQQQQQIVPAPPPQETPGSITSTQKKQKKKKKKVGGSSSSTPPPPSSSSSGQKKRRKHRTSTSPRRTSRSSGTGTGSGHHESSSSSSLSPSHPSNKHNRRSTSPRRKSGSRRSTSPRRRSDGSRIRDSSTSKHKSSSSPRRSSGGSGHPRAASSSPVPPSSHKKETKDNHNRKKTGRRSRSVEAKTKPRNGRTRSVEAKTKPESPKNVVRMEPAKAIVAPPTPAATPVETPSPAPPAVSSSVSPPPQTPQSQTPKHNYDFRGGGGDDEDDDHSGVDWDFSVIDGINSVVDLESSIREAFQRSETEKVSNHIVPNPNSLLDPTTKLNNHHQVGIYEYRATPDHSDDELQVVSDTEEQDQEQQQAASTTTATATATKKPKRKSMFSKLFGGKTRIKTLTCAFNGEKEGSRDSVSTARDSVGF